MKALSIDLETYSSVDLGKSSVYRYVESPDFDILLLGFSADGSPVQVVDLAQGEQIPPEVIDALTDDTVNKWAFNANFERVCLSEWLRRNSYPLHNEHYSTPNDPCMGYLDPVGWHCTMVWSAYLGLPLSLKDGICVGRTSRSRVPVHGHPDIRLPRRQPDHRARRRDHRRTP